MKCAKIIGKKQFEVGNIEPPKSKNGSVVIKVDSCGICGSDIHYWDSGEPVGLVLGHEFAGAVIDAGDRNDLKVGDRVTGLPISPCLTCEACKNGNIHFCKKTWSDAVGLSLTNPGGYGEIISCRSDMVKKIPDIVSYEEASMIEPSAVALHAINLANIKVGAKVLIIGGGIIGLMSAEFAKLNGASLISLMETNVKRGTKALKFGKVDKYYDALDKDVISKVINDTQKGFDVVIECCGNSPAVSEAIMSVKPGGTIVLVGVSLNPVTIPSVVSVLSEIKMQGAIAYTEKEFEDCIELISKKVIDVEKYIDDKVPIEKIQESFERLTSGTDDAIKIIVKN